MFDLSKNSVVGENYDLSTLWWEFLEHFLLVAAHHEGITQVDVQFLKVRRTGHIHAPKVLEGVTIALYELVPIASHTLRVQGTNEGPKVDGALVHRCAGEEHSLARPNRMNARLTSTTTPNVHGRLSLRITEGVSFVNDHVIPIETLELVVVTLKHFLIDDHYVSVGENVVSLLDFRSKEIGSTICARLAHWVTISVKLVTCFCFHDPDRETMNIPLLEFARPILLQRRRAHDQDVMTLALEGVVDADGLDGLTQAWRIGDQNVACW